MDISKIEELAELMKRHGLCALSVKEGDDEIHMETEGKRAAFEPSPLQAQPHIPESGAAQTEVAVNEIRSPMVGVFYVAGSPDAEPFVGIGQHVKKGDVLCVIEAMKLMNEISAERDGVISDICVENGQLVEFGQCLFKYI